MKTGKIWIGNDKILLNRVVDKLNSIGITESSNISCRVSNNPSCIFISDSPTFGAYGQEYSRENFDNNIKNNTFLNEISIYELLHSANSELNYEIY